MFFFSCICIYLWLSMYSTCLYMYIYIYGYGAASANPPTPKGDGCSVLLLMVTPPVACTGGVFGMLVMGGMYVCMYVWMDGWMDVQNYTLLQYCYQWTTALAECCYHNACVKCRCLELRYNWSRGKQLKLTDWTIAVNNTLKLYMVAEQWFWQQSRWAPKQNQQATSTTGQSLDPDNKSGSSGTTQPNTTTWQRMQQLQH